MSAPAHLVSPEARGNHESGTGGAGGLRVASVGDPMGAGLGSGACLGAWRGRRPTGDGG